jgi:hypothetical protein
MLLQQVNSQVTPDKLCCPWKTLVITLILRYVQMFSQEKHLLFQFPQFYILTKPQSPYPCLPYWRDSSLSRFTLLEGGFCKLRKNALSIKIKISTLKLWVKSQQLWNSIIPLLLAEYC